LARQLSGRCRKIGAHVAVLNRGSLSVAGTEQLTVDRNSASTVRAAQAFTKPGDLVLDFHVGGGITLTEALAPRP
jgi:hypothetical protein